MSQEALSGLAVVRPDIFDEAVNRADPADVLPRPHKLLYSPEFHPFPDHPDLGFTAVIDLTAARLEARQAFRGLHPGAPESVVRAHTPTVHKEVPKRGGRRVVKGIEITVVHPPEVSDGRYDSDYAMAVAATDDDGWWNETHRHLLVPGPNSGHILAMMNERRLTNISYDPHDPLPDRRAKFEAEANKRLVEGIHYGVHHHEGKRSLRDRNGTLVPKAAAFLIGASAALGVAAEKATGGALSVKEAAAAGVVATAGMVMGANKLMGGKFFGTKKVRRAYRKEMTDGHRAYVTSGRRVTAKQSIAEADDVQLLQLVPTNSEDHERVGYTGSAPLPQDIPPAPRNVESMRSRRDNTRLLVPVGLVGIMALGTVLIPLYELDQLTSGHGKKAPASASAYQGPPPVFGATQPPVRDTAPKTYANRTPNPDDASVDPGTPENTECAPGEAAVAEGLQAAASLDQDSSFTNPVIGFAKDRVGVAAVPRQYDSSDPACFEPIPGVIPADHQYRTIGIIFDESGVARVPLADGAEHFRAYHFGSEPMRAERVGNELRFFGQPGIGESVIIRTTA